MLISGGGWVGGVDPERYENGRDACDLPRRYLGMWRTLIGPTLRGENLPKPPLIWLVLDDCILPSITLISCGESRQLIFPKMGG